MGFETIVIVAYLILINIASFIAYGSDKHRARTGRWRTPERTLLILAFMGGALGALVGMRFFLHKTRKPLFRILVPIALVLNVILGGSALYFSDYSHADTAALEAAGTSTDSVEVRTIGRDKLAFVPQDPIAGLVFYPGAKVQPEAYAPLLKRCADRGILCVLVRPPLNFALLDVAAADGVAELFPDIHTWVMAGHSLGGVAMAQYVAAHPTSANGLMFLASYPASDLSDFGGWSLSVVGSNDRVLNRAAYEDARANLPQHATELVVEGGNHAYFGDYGAQRGDGEATLTRSEQQAATVEALVSMLDI